MQTKSVAGRRGALGSQQGRDTKSISLGSSATVLRIDLNTDGNVKSAIHATCTGKPISSAVRRSGIDFALVQRCVAILRKTIQFRGTAFEDTGVSGTWGDNLGESGVVTGWHGDLIPGGALLLAAGLLVKEWHESLVAFAVEVVDFVSAGEKIGNGLGWGLICDSAADDVDDEAVVVFA